MKSEYPGPWRYRSVCLSSILHLPRRRRGPGGHRRGVGLPVSGAHPRPLLGNADHDALWFGIARARGIRRRCGVAEHRVERRSRRSDARWHRRGRHQAGKAEVEGIARTPVAGCGSTPGHRVRRPGRCPRGCWGVNVREPCSLSGMDTIARARVKPGHRGRGRDEFDHHCGTDQGQAPLWPRLETDDYWMVVRSSRPMKDS